MTVSQVTCTIFKGPLTHCGHLTPLSTELDNEDLAAAEFEVNILAVVALMHGRKRMQKKRRQRRSTVWVRPWLLERPLYGQYEHLLQEVNKEDRIGYKDCFRVAPGAGCTNLTQAQGSTLSRFPNLILETFLGCTNVFGFKS